MSVFQLVQTYHNAVHATYETALTMASATDKPFHKERVRMVEKKNEYVREIEEEFSRRLMDKITKG